MQIEIWLATISNKISGREIIVILHQMITAENTKLHIVSFYDSLDEVCATDEGGKLAPL